jgi:hypothetical protein
MIRSKAKPALAFILLWAMLFLHYQTNFAGIAPYSIYENWQLNGQARVLGGIVADIHGIDSKGANMGLVYPEGTDPQAVPAGETWDATYEIFADYPEGTDVVFDAYPTQFGLQQIFYSWLAQTFNLTLLDQIQAITALLSAAALACLGVIYWRRMDPLFATLFVVFMGAMPLTIAMGRNLYWSPFLMWLPAILSLVLYRAEKPAARTALLIAISGAMFLKSASNYEYITSVTLLAVATFLVVPFFDGKRWPDLRMAFLVWLACVVGFVMALLMHAQMRGDDILDGLRLIYTEDISRRTFGDASNFSGETAQSLQASPIDVLRIYLIDLYPGMREMIVPGKLFLALIVLCLAGLLHKAITGHEHFRRDFAVFVVFLSVPVSWFVLAKGHAFTQTHINFVLWYFGFMAALFHCSWSSVHAIFGDLRGRWQRHRTASVHSGSYPDDMK